MKVYISIPKNESVEESSARAHRIAQAIYDNGDQPVTPIELCPFSDYEYNESVGIDIGALIGCDAIYIDDGWEESKACLLEKAAADIYGLKYYFLIV